MTENTKPEGIEDTPGTAEEHGHVIAEPHAVELFTDWANDDRLDAPESFDEDQAAVHEWMEADDKLRLEALETSMTLADAEELIATAKSVASEHMRRAERARNLVTVIAARLGRQAEALTASETMKAVPVQPEPRPAPTATRKMELPSAL